MAGTGWKDGKTEQVARSFSRYGWLGFAVQSVMLIAVFLLGLATFGFSGQGIGAFSVANVLSFLVLTLPAFTTFWCWRYVRLGARLAEAEPVSAGGARRMLWVGIWAGTIGAGASLLSLFGAASALLVTLLSNPQVGIQIAPAPGAAAVYSVSAIDAVSIMALILALTAELLVIFVSLRLLFIVRAAER